MQHVELAVLVAAATVVLIEAFEGVLDAGKVGDASVDRLEEVEHREESTVEGGNVVVVEGERGCSGCNFLAVLHEFLNAPYFGKRRGHGANAPRPDGCGVLGQAATAAHTGAAYVHNHLEIVRHGFHPSLGQPHALLLREHVALARGAVDEYALQTVACQQGGIGGNGLVVHVAVSIERRKRCVNQTFDFFHDREIY